jgi:hypothetical protein
MSVPEGVFDMVRAVCTVRHDDKDAQATFGLPCSLWKTVLRDPLTACQAIASLAVTEHGACVHNRRTTPLHQRRPLPSCAATAAPRAMTPGALPTRHRARVQLAAVKVTLDTLGEGFRGSFAFTCETCNGAGIMTCPRCKGTKTLRARPARLVTQWSGKKMLLHHAHEVNDCFQCGPVLQTDFHLRGMDEGINNTTMWMRLMKQYQSALANKPKLALMWPPSAGCVWCPSCHGTRDYFNWTFDKRGMYQMRPDHCQRVRLSPRRAERSLAPRRTRRARMRARRRASRLGAHGCVHFHPAYGCHHVAPLTIVCRSREGRARADVRSGVRPAFAVSACPGVRSGQTGGAHAGRHARRPDRKHRHFTPYGARPQAAHALPRVPSPPPPHPQRPHRRAGHLRAPDARQWLRHRVSKEV